MPECFGGPVVTTLVCIVACAREAGGAPDTWHSLRSPFSGRPTIEQDSGVFALRDRAQGRLAKTVDTGIGNPTTASAQAKESGPRPLPADCRGNPGNKIVIRSLFSVSPASARGPELNISNEPRWTMSKMSNGMAVLALTSVLALSGAHGQNSKSSKADDSFLKQAMQGDMAEVKMGQLAQEKGANDQVKQFGQTLVSDHQQNLDKAKSLAEKIGMTPPESVNAEQKAMYEKMSKLSGQQFDKEFAQHMVQDHKKDIGKFERESKKSGDVANFAQNTLPVLKKHLEIAESLNGQKTTGRAR